MLALLPRHRPSAAKGFTLIELMIGLAIVVILASLALPAYLDSVRKNRRADAFATLTQVQQAQERWRANASAYTTELTTALPNGLGLTSGTPGGFYTISISEATGSRHIALATAVAGSSQAADTNCKVLGVLMDGGNIRYGGATSTIDWTAADTDPRRCWAR